MERKGNKPLLLWAQREALNELDRITPKVKANRLAVDKKRIENQSDMSLPEMISVARSLDNEPDLVQQLAREYDQLVRDGTYEELYGEYWPGKKLVAFRISV